MITYRLYCPLCDAWLGVFQRCPTCGWARADKSPEVGQPACLAWSLGALPVAGSHLVRDKARVWASVRVKQQGALACLDVPRQHAEICELPNHFLALDLCAGGGMVWVGANDAQTIASKDKAVLAYDAVDGTKRWSSPVPGACTLSPVAWYDDNLYLVADDASLIAVKSTTGELLYRVPMAGADTRIAPSINNALLMTSAGLATYGRPGVQAFERATGRELWRAETSGPLAFAPALSEHVVYIALVDGLSCLDARTGNPIWLTLYRPPRLTSKGALTSPPVACANQVLFGCGDWNSGQAGYALHAVDQATGRNNWTRPLSSRLSLVPLVVGEEVFLVDDSGVLYCLALNSGRVIWSLSTTVRPATAPMVWGDDLIWLTVNGQVQRVRLFTEAARPTEPAETYVNREDWIQVAVAYALDCEMSRAGECMLRAGDAVHALDLFQRAHDNLGIARSEEALGHWQEAITQYQTIDNKEGVARVLSKIGRHKESGDCFLAMGDAGHAAVEYQTAGAWLEAARAFEAADQIEGLRSLSAIPEAGPSIVHWLAESTHWQFAMDIYRRQGDWENLARVLITQNRLQEAFDLWWQKESWIKCRALAEEMNDPLASARVCIQQVDYPQAARYYELAGEWKQALANYDRASLLDDSLRMLINLNRHFEAATRLVAARRYAEAAIQYSLAAEQASAEVPCDAHEVSALWRAAGENYALAGMKVKAHECLHKSAKANAEPLLEMIEARIDSALVTGHESRLEVTISNQGYGPARQVQLKATGKGFGLESEHTVGNIQPVLASGETTQIRAGLVPINPGPEVELRLSLTYIVEEANVISIGPFQAFFSVGQPEVKGISPFHIENFQYIGPGGLNAQDAIMIRPQYGVSENSRSFQVVTEPGEKRRTIKRFSGTSSNERYCPRCGHVVAEDAHHCSNPSCGAIWCCDCGTILDEAAATCPECGRTCTGKDQT